VRLHLSADLAEQAVQGPKLAHAGGQLRDHSRALGSVARAQLKLQRRAHHAVGQELVALGLSELALGQVEAVEHDLDGELLEPEQDRDSTQREPVTDREVGRDQPQQRCPEQTSK
jgi:hypothetical protein